MGAAELTKDGLLAHVLAGVAKQSTELCHGSPHRLRLLAMTERK